jgi:two-component system, NarL family, invasion response regulator UvrY
MRALIADDHRIIRKAMKELLLDDGAFAEVEEAADGLLALELLIAEDFDLAIVDIDMPGMDGLSLIEEVKRLKPRQSFLVLSAMPVEAYAARAAMMGAAGFLPKGCRPKAIIAAAKRAVGR